MDDYLTKPFSIAQLREVIIRMLKPHSSSGLASAAVATATGPAETVGATAAPAAVAGEAPLAVTVDAAALAQIAELDPGGKKGLVKRIVTLFIDDSARLVAELATALESGDADAARRSVHTLKSTAANIGGTTLAHAAAAAEQGLKSGDVAAARAALPQLQALREATLAQLAQQQPGVAA
jgi:HPt (histidine-containing phosphotransfer) domain-containing protein